MCWIKSQCDNTKEQPLPRHGACCLGSLNLSEFVEDPYTKDAFFDMDGFEHAVNVAVAALDDLIDENADRHPLSGQRDMSLRYRNIGLGVMGYATALMKLGLTYGSDEAVWFTDYLFEKLFNTAVLRSSELADERGPFPEFTEKVCDATILRKHFPDDTIKEFKMSGLRNCSLISIAPTGSLATMLGVSGGCEPEYAISYMRRVIGGGGEEHVYDMFCKAAREYMDFHGTDKLPPCFVGAHDIPWKNRIQMQAAMQRHVDTAISSTINLPHDTPISEVEQLFLAAWENNLKGITIFRDGCKKAGILSTPSEKAEEPLKRGEVRKVNDDVVGKKRKLTTGCGSLHLSAFFDPESGNLMETYLSKGSTGGCNNFMVGLSRMISLAARSGVDIRDIADQLDSTGSCPSYSVRRATKKDTSKGSCCPMAIGNALLEMWKEMRPQVADNPGEAAETEGCEECRKAAAAS